MRVFRSILVAALMVAGAGAAEAQWYDKPDRDLGWRQGPAAHYYVPPRPVYVPPPVYYVPPPPRYYAPPRHWNRPHWDRPHSHRPHWDRPHRRHW